MELNGVNVPRIGTGDRGFDAGAVTVNHDAFNWSLVRRAEGQVRVGFGEGAGRPGQLQVGLEEVRRRELAHKLHVMLTHSLLEIADCALDRLVLWVARGGRLQKDYANH